MALDEPAAATATPTITIHLDLAKFYDNHLPTLMRTARLLDYPLRARALCGQMFLALRVIRVNGSFATATAIHLQTGMVPGSGQANHLVRALLCELQKRCIVSPMLMGRQYVDDVMLRLEAPTRELGNHHADSRCRARAGSPKLQLASLR